MPSQSKSQQRLMGVAYAVKSGDMQLSDVDSEYRDKVKELVDGMSLKDLKDFASTPHEGLPEVVENITPDSIGGMGQVQLPTETEVGSGDIPAGRGDAKKRYKKKMKFKHKIATYEEFLSKEDSQINEAKFKAGQVWIWKHVEGNKEVEVVDVKSNGDVVGRVKGTSQDFVVRDANKWLKKKVSESLVNEARSINKIQKDWANVTDMMKDAVANWKSATGKDKEDLLDQLKVLTISKKKLEAELNDAVMGKDKDAELVGALESLVIESSMSEIDIIAQEAKNLKEFIKEVVASFKLEDTKELRAWLTTLYTPYQR